MKRRALGYFIAIGAVIALAAIVYLTVLLVNAGKIADDARSETDLLWERRNVALKIISHDWVGRPASELDALAIELKANGVIVDTEEDAREIGDFVFKVEDGIVTEVYDFDGKME